MRLTFFALIVFFALVLAFGCHGKDPGPEPPDNTTMDSTLLKFTLTTLDGQRLNMVQYVGDVVLINLWDTPSEPSRRQIPLLVSFYAQNYSRGLRVFGVALGTQGDSAVNNAVDSLHISYPVGLMDTSVSRLYPPPSTLPTTYVLRRDGHLDATVVGFHDSTFWAQKIGSLL